MGQIIDFINKLNTQDIIDIIVAIGIMILFIALSSSISYMIVKLFKIKAKKREIKESAFYEPLRIFINILGVYIAVLFLKQPLEIPDEIMQIFTKAFKIISILAFAKGLAKSFTLDSTLIKKYKQKSKKEIEETTLNFILKIVRVIIYTLAIILVITELGFNLNGIITGLGIGGVIITLAAQDTAKNLFGGATIFFDKPFAVGDWIQMDTYEGTVEDITFRTTRIRTSENSIVNVPNSVISESSVINWSRLEKRRYKLNICIETNTPLEKLQKVEERIKTMLVNKDDVIDDTIIVRFDGITTNGLNLYICSYTNSVDYMSYLEEKERINYKIMQILNEENVKMAYDTKTIIMNS